MQKNLLCRYQGRLRGGTESTGVAGTTCNSGLVGNTFDNCDPVASGRETIPGEGDRDSDRSRRRSTTNLDGVVKRIYLMRGVCRRYTSLKPTIEALFSQLVGNAVHLQ